LIRERPASRISAVMALKGAYMNAVHGRAPDPQWLNEISSTDLTRFVVILFSSRLASDTHILAALLLDREVAERYHFCRHVAEAKLPYFSWHWRLQSFSVSQSSLANVETRTAQHCVPIAQMSSLSSCKTFLRASQGPAQIGVKISFKGRF
jgi:hypothetical protein